MAAQTADKRIAWRVAGNRTLGASTLSPTTGTATFHTPLSANLTGVALTPAGACSPGPCACNFTASQTCPPPALAAGANATCGFVCSPGAANVSIAAAFNTHTVTATISAAHSVVNVSACANLTAPLLAARAYPPGSWPSPQLMCDGFSHDVETTTPPPAASECASVAVANYSAPSAAELSDEAVALEANTTGSVAIAAITTGGAVAAITDGGGVLAADTAVALLPCPTVEFSIAALGYTRTKQWNWQAAWPRIEHSLRWLHA